MFLSFLKQIKMLANIDKRHQCL